MKRIVLVALSVACVLLPATANAAVQELTIDPQVLIIDGDSVRISGTITCDAGDRYRVGTQSFTTSTGTQARRGPFVGGDCSGSPQIWHVVAERSTGPAFEAGATATVTALGQTGTPGDNSPNHSVQVSQEVTLQ